MERCELEQWLCGPDAALLPPSVVADALGLSAEMLADTTFLRTTSRVRSLWFTLAVLRDAFADDDDLAEWLEVGCDDLGGLAPREALLAGKHELVEHLATRTWNELVGLTEAI